MKIFLKVLEKLKKKEAGNPYLDCRYDKGWNAAIKKIEGIIASYNISDMWIPVEVKLPKEPNTETTPEEMEEYIVTISGVETSTILTYIGNGIWGSVTEYGIAYYPVLAWQPKPEVYKPWRKTK